MQQHSVPSPHSIHLVFPAPESPFTIEEMVDEADEPGPFIFTSCAVAGVAEHMLSDGFGLLGFDLACRYATEMLVELLHFFGFAFNYENARVEVIFLLSEYKGLTWYFE